MSFSIGDRKKIESLTRASVEGTMLGLSSVIMNSRWIAKGNIYSNDIINRLYKSDPITSSDKKNLAQYITASAILHTNDGWSYLGRAISCLMVGDAHRALHLAYYAELRAVMALLASEGIGIFDTNHFVIDNQNSTSKLETGKGTHQVAWRALELWSKTRGSGALFSRLITPEGIPLDDWLAPIGGSAALAAQARDWFLKWGMDLALARNDRQARNESSYRPDGIPSSWAVSSTNVLEFTKDLWSALEPRDQSNFDQLDRHILRIALEKQFSAVNRINPSANNPTFVAFIKKIVLDQGFPPPTSDRLVDFLLRKIGPEDPQIFKNSLIKPNGISTDPISILSRAAFLLRVATGSGHDLLKHAGIGARTLSFWWSAIGIARGLWGPSGPPEQLTDLWADIRETLSDVDEATASDPAALSTINGLGYGVSGRLNMLCSHERVGLWGLCPV